MEFTKLRGFWKSKATSQSDDMTEFVEETQSGYTNKSKAIAKTTPKSKNGKDNNFKININTSKSNFNSEQNTLETLDEIQPEVTAEGYGLRTPYGTHIDLDFMKYCDTITTGSKQKLKRTYSLRQPKNQAPPLLSPRIQYSQTRMHSHPSSESLNSLSSDGAASVCSSLINKADRSLFETRRRLEAFRSFRTKSYETAKEATNRPRENGDTNEINFERNRRGSNSSISSIGNNSYKLSGIPQLSSRQFVAIRNQMSAALARIRELEEQVKHIPTLEVQVSLLKQEKNCLEKELEQFIRNPPDTKVPSKSTFTSSALSGIFSISSTETLSPKNDAVFEANSPQSVNDKTFLPALATNKLHIPPPVPKRRHCSIGVGSNIPMSDIVCYSKRNFQTKGVGTNCIFPLQTSVKSSTNVHDDTTDIATLAPPPDDILTWPKTNCNLTNSSCQTEFAAYLVNAATQTRKPKYRDRGCGNDSLVELCDQACDPIVSDTADVSTMTRLDVVKTQDQQTSSRDLIQVSHVRVGSEVITKDASTNTSEIVRVTEETSSDDLIQQNHVGIGVDLKMDHRDAAVSARPIATKDIALCCSLPIKPHTQSLDKMTMTLLSGTQILHSVDTNSVASGVEAELNQHTCKTQSNTENRVSDYQCVTNKLPVSSEDVTTSCTDIFPNSTEDASSSSSLYLDIGQNAEMNDLKLKSIMKKPGTPTSPKKFLRFADDVKSDDSDFTSSDEEDSSSEEELVLEEVVFNDGVKTEKGKGERENSAKKDDLLKKSELSFHPNISAKGVTTKIFSTHQESIKNAESSTVTIDDKYQRQIQLLSQQSRKDTTQNNCVKYSFKNKLLQACDVVEKHLKNSKLITQQQLVSSTLTIETEWFRTAAQSDSTKKVLEEFLTDLETTSFAVVRKVVNMTDSSGNSVLHYAISHGNTEIVDRLLAIEELDVNKPNLSGFTPTMLAALCEIETSEEHEIFKQLFTKSDVNLHARDAGQTALMLAVSHGNIKTAELLLTCGAEINAADFDGSTALMCATEHGKLEIVRILLATPECDTEMVDAEGYSALNIAMEMGHKEIAVLLYTYCNSVPATVL